MLPCLIIFSMHCTYASSAEVRIRSSRVSFENFDFQLRSEGKKIELYAKGTNVQQNKSGDSFQKSQELSWDGVANPSIVDLQLSTWNTSQLCAVVAIRETKTFRYFYRTFRPSAVGDPILGPDFDGTSKLFRSKAIENLKFDTGWIEFSASTEELEILAVNSQYKGDGIVIVLGKVSKILSDVKVDRAQVFIHYCPLPEIGEGFLTNLSATPEKQLESKSN